ncbi:uncharacterized protein [Diabrotica undecimpunctata]|uniref:uncharacterized protein n=1 Tax=Diabrotica undecimpunctata TaxID=50387 RepID=UPI003B641E54
MGFCFVLLVCQRLSIKYFSGVNKMPRLKSINKRSTKRSRTLIKCQKNKKEISVVACGSTSDKENKEAVQSTLSDLHEFSFISSDEYESINNHRLEIQKEPVKQTYLNGHRIVDLHYVIQWALNLQFAHSKVCTMGNLQIIDEKHKGLVSTVILLCNMCGYKTEKSTENPCEQSTINYGAVWDTLSTGGTDVQLTGLLGALDIPSISYRLFHNIEIELGDKWIEGLWKSIEEAGIKERELAVAEGQLDSDGIPWTTVYCDEGWSHRSYGHSYNASSGVAVIIGKFTKKLLYLGVRNKYCSLCARYESKNEPVPLHTCCKNWQGSSTAMETSILVEGFKQSQIVHGLKFLQFIADGDSSVYAKICEEVAYGQYVTKIECRNHAIKNYGKALYKIKADTTVNKEARALLTNNKIKELQNCCTKIINSAAYADVENLKANLEKSIDHVFGNHVVCSDQYCTKQQQSDAHLMTLVKNTGLYFHINGSLQRLISKGHRLIDKETNNRAEMYMSILCKFNAGKRLNLWEG